MNSRHHQHFGLTLMVNHACNLRCTYCYTGAKFSAPMDFETGRRAIERGFNTLARGGRLDLGFFGGEPLLESERIIEWMALARKRSVETGKRVRFDLTTNGTLTGDSAWKVMTSEDLDLAISFDGNPEIHDRHRRDARGRGSAVRVVETMRKLLDCERLFRVVVVVRPDNLCDLPDGLVFLHYLGIRHIELSLDLWTIWKSRDVLLLQTFVEKAGRFWRERLPHTHVSWFDSKAGALAGMPVKEENSCCGFGDGEIAVSPSGRLYPCERVIGEDRPDQALCLPGHVLEGDDFSEYTAAEFQQCAPCSACAIASACDSTCRCSNFVRTGDVNRPDGLICALNKATTRVTSELISECASLARIESP